MFDDPQLLLWLGVVALGALHGLNPAMGWPLAVARGLGERRSAGVFSTFVPLGAGHLLAMAVVLVPFALLSWVFTWQRELRVAAGALVLLFGAARLWAPRQPRWLVQRFKRLHARVRPTQLLLWSVLMATAHGAALMLLPFVMGLCTGNVATPDDADGVHAGMMSLMRSDIGTAVAVSLLHAAAMVASGLLIAWLVYRHLGLRVLRSTWLNLDTVWALGLMASGAAGVLMATL